MKALHVFIDTEFTNLSVPKLISIGLVSENGEESYFEVEHQDSDCSDFVRENVLPSLSNSPDTKRKQNELSQELIAWFNVVKTSSEQNIEICYDADIDWVLFSHLFDMHVPQWIRPLNIEYQISLLLHHSFYKENKLREHHALNDARANAFAYRAQLLR